MTSSTFVFPLLGYRVIDGDSIEVEVDLGMRLRWIGSLRLHRIDAPEMRGTQRPAGLAVRRIVEAWLDERAPRGLRVHSHEWDKFGRLLGDVQDMTLDGLLTDYLLQRGVVHPYIGAGKREWTTEELDEIARAEP